jgi:hypothetical protein
LSVDPLAKTVINNQGITWWHTFCYEGRDASADSGVYEQ